MIEKGMVGKNIVVSDEDFNIEKIYKEVKNIADDLDYTFVEKEQGSKSGKYGNEIGFKFIFDKEVDYFGELIFEINFEFGALSKLKNGLDHGDCKVTINGKVIFDYKNRWGMTKFNKFLLGMYLKVADGAMKKSYIIPLITEGNKIHDSIKNIFGLYIA